MSIILLSDLVGIGSCSVGQARYDMLENSDDTGHMAVRLFGPPRWIFSIGAPAHLPMRESSIWESLLLKLRGGANHLAAWDPIRRYPEGSMRGTMTLSGAHSLGDESLIINGGVGEAGKTLLMGDWLQIGTGIGTSQLVKVVDDAVANGSGVITVNIEPTLRIDFASGVSVNWDRALGYYKSLSKPNWNYGYARTQNGFLVELLESWTP